MDVNAPSLYIVFDQDRQGRDHTFHHFRSRYDMRDFFLEILEYQDIPKDEDLTEQEFEEKYNNYTDIELMDLCNAYRYPYCEFSIIFKMNSETHINVCRYPFETNNACGCKECKEKDNHTRNQEFEMPSRT